MRKLLTAAGGVLYRNSNEGVEVLLIYRFGKWDLPKGKVEAGESVEEAALREVEEETGVALPKIYTSLSDTYHEYESDGTDYGKTTHWYVMKSAREQPLKPQIEEGIEKLEWVPVNTAIQKIGYLNLKEVLYRFKDWYKTQQPSLDT